VRLYSRSLATEEVERLARSARAAALAALPADKRSAKETDELYDWWLGTLDTKFRELSRAKQALDEEQAAIKSRGTIAHVM
jgi:hypothetical protein